jgi:hypothetical protein
MNGFSKAAGNCRLNLPKIVQPAACSNPVDEGGSGFRNLFGKFKTNV